MKRIKALVSMLAAAALLTVLPPASSMTASAEGSTYAVKCIDGKWYYQKGSTYDDSVIPPREIYYMLTEDWKDGDAVVVYNDQDNAPALDLGNVRVGNLTIPQNNKFTIVFAGSYDICYVLGGSTCAINGDVTNAFVYDYPNPATCSFNSNVSNLDVAVNNTDHVSVNLSCGGAVRHLYVHTEGKTFYDLYAFQTNSLSIENGILKTPAWQYSTTPTESDLATQAGIQQGTTQAPAATATPAPTKAPSNDNEYDDVPKTGDSVSYVQLYLCLSGAAILCFLGSRLLKKSAARSRR